MPSPATTGSWANSSDGAYAPSPAITIVVYCPIGVVTRTSAVRRPAPVGVNVTPTLHVARGFKGRLAQLFVVTAKSPAFSPSIATDLIEVDSIEMFFTSKKNSVLDVPTVTTPRSLPAGSIRSVGAPPAPRTRAEIEVAWNPSSATVTVAETGFGSDGLNVSTTEQSPPGGTGASRVHVLFSVMIV